MPASAADILTAGAETFRARNTIYGDNYKHFGEVMAAMHPGGVVIETAEQWNRLGVFVQCVSKLTRYAANTGGHKDSAHDLMVYAAMLEELTSDG